MSEKGAMSSPAQYEISYEKHVPVGLKGAWKSKYVFLCCLTAAIGGFSFGYDQGVVSVILVMPSFLKEFPRIDATASAHSGFWKGLATAILELGGVLGALTQSILADRFSRRRAMQFGVIIFVWGAIMQTASQNYATLAIGRFIGGAGVGMLALVAPVYMGEVAPAEIRGSLLVLEEWMIVLGAVISFWIGYGSRYIDSEWSFRLPFLIQIFPVLFLAFAAFYMPPSPRWLALQGRDAEAREVLAKLRGLPAEAPAIEHEWTDVIVEATFQREVLAKRHKVSMNRSEPVPILQDILAYFDLFKSGCWRRTSVGALIVTFQQFVGINALIYYAPTIFTSIGLDYELSLLMTGIMNIAQLIGVTLSIPLMDNVGRKPLLLFGAIGMFASQLCLAIIVGLYHSSWLQHQAQGWVGTAFIFWYMIAFGISWGPIPWSMPAEIFPSSLRAKGTAFSQATQWFFNFVIGLVTPPMIQNIGFGTYVFFAAFCLISAVWVVFLCPETKQVTLEQMDQLFKDRSGQNDEAAKARIRAELGNLTQVTSHHSDSQIKDDV